MRFHRVRGASPVCAAILSMLMCGALPALAQDTAVDAPAEDPVEAVVNGIELHRSDVLESARDLPRAYQDQIEQIYPALVERLIDLTLLSDEARRRALQDDVEVRERVAKYENLVIREILISRAVKEGMTEEAIRARYDRFVEEFQPQQELRASHILVASEEEATAIIAELDGGGDFEAIAKEKSTDTGSGANGGDLGFFTADQMVPEFSEAAVALEPGAHSASPVQSRFGWHIIKLEEKRETQPPSFDQARPELENQLSQEVVSELVTQLRGDAEIVMPEPPAADPAAPAEDAPAPAEEAPAQ